MSTEKIEKSESYDFADCVVDADLRELTMAGEVVTMQPKAFELLLYLIRNRNRAVNKDELQDALWPRTIVTETALTRCVMKARRAVGDDADKQAIIKTVHGHGYRFIAAVADSAIAADTAIDIDPAAPFERRNFHALKIGSAATLLLAAIVIAWLYLSPPALSGPVRLAVLPIENATGDEEMNWVSKGLVDVMNRMLQDGGIDTVRLRDVAGLAGDLPQAELIASGSEFREKLARTAAATHVIAAKLEDNHGLYRLTYTLAGADKRPIRRTMVGTKPTTLVKDVVDTVTAQIATDPPPSNMQASVSQDDFLNEVYARAMAMYHEGRYEDAKALFEVILEQEPHLFWPRYERALAMRNLRDFDGAERELVALRRGFDAGNRGKERITVENALGVMYLGRRRNDEARDAFDSVIDVAQRSGDQQRVAIGYQNLALLEKNLGNTQLAYQHMLAAENIYKDLDRTMLPGSLLNNLSGVLMQMGQFEQAEQYSLRAVENFRYTGERLFESYALNRLSDIYTSMRYYDDAEEMAERSLSVRRELNDERGVASSLINLADIAAQRGDITRSMQYAKQAHDIGSRIDDPPTSIAGLVRIARAEARLGNLQRSVQRWAEIESIAMSNSDPANVFRARLGLAGTYIEMQRFDDALAIANELHRETIDNGRRRDETAALRLFAGIYTAQGRHRDALLSLQQAYDIAADIGDTVVQASLHILLADTYLELGDTAAASPHVEAAAESRGEDFDSLKVQARYASLTGNADDAVALMEEARSRAGEGWQDDDDELLASYRAATSNEQDRD